MLSCVWPHVHNSLLVSVGQSQFLIKGVTLNFAVLYCNKHDLVITEALSLPVLNLGKIFG